mmetsp:Transcript_8620/g.21599  ORF Transcript_8620/g.21599 Transcript_8620/m.21599 type:complete len:97 (-) Transcript_8620:948-1238(-)
MDGVDRDTTWLVDPFETLSYHLYRFVHDVLCDDNDNNNDDNNDIKSNNNDNNNNNDDDEIPMVRTVQVIKIDTIVDTTICLSTTVLATCVFCVDHP